MNAMAIPPRTAISMPFIRVPATLMTEDTPAPKTMPMRRGLGMIRTTFLPRPVMPRTKKISAIRRPRAMVAWMRSGPAAKFATPHAPIRGMAGVIHPADTGSPRQTCTLYSKLFRVTMIMASSKGMPSISWCAVMELIGIAINKNPCRSSGISGLKWTNGIRNLKMPILICGCSCPSMR